MLFVDASMLLLLQISNYTKILIVGDKINEQYLKINLVEIINIWLLSISQPTYTDNSLA